MPDDDVRVCPCCKGTGEVRGGRQGDGSAWAHVGSKALDMTRVNELLDTIRDQVREVKQVQQPPNIPGADAARLEMIGGQMLDIELSDDGKHRVSIPGCLVVGWDRVESGALLLKLKTRFSLLLNQRSGTVDVVEQDNTGKKFKATSMRDVYGNWIEK